MQYAPAPMRHAPRITIALATLAGTAAATVASCGSNCASDCVPNSVRVTVQGAVNAPIMTLSWSGPACPSYQPFCRGNDPSTVCSHIDITAQAPGACDLTVNFSDGRPSQVVHAMFGPAGQQGCCGGFPVFGDSVFYIPLSADAGIVGSSGNADAVSTLPRDGSVSDGGTDAPATQDAPAQDDAPRDTTEDAPIDQTEAGG